MRFSIRHADKIVGLLVILALAALVFVVFMLGKNQRWFAKDSQYLTYFSSASGIGRNMAVQYKGFTIGHVKEIRLADNDRVEVTFTIFEEYIHRAVEGSLVEVQVSPIGLGNSFIFHPGRGTNQLEAGALIPEINSPEARLYITAGLSAVPRASDSISNIVNQVNQLLETINISLSGSMGYEDLPLGLILSNLETTTTGIAVLAEALHPVAKGISDPSGTVMSILDGDGPVYNSIASLLVSLSGIVGDLKKISEFIPEELPQIAVLINELTTALRSAQDVLTAVSNNPLLKGGIPERKETGPGGASPRNLGF